MKHRMTTVATILALLAGPVVAANPVMLNMDTPTPYAEVLFGVEIHHDIYQGLSAAVYEVRGGYDLGPVAVGAFLEMPLTSDDNSSSDLQSERYALGIDAFLKPITAHGVTPYLSAGVGYYWGATDEFRCLSPSIGVGVRVNCYQSLYLFADYRSVWPTWDFNAHDLRFGVLGAGAGMRF